MTFRVRIALYVALAAAAAVTAVARAAHAQETPKAASRAPGATTLTLMLTPPKLIVFVPAPLPETARAQPPREEVGVELELTIDATGKVTTSPSRPGQGGGYDEVAEAARDDTGRTITVKYQDVSALRIRH